MGRKLLSYDDAVKLLGGQSKVLSGLTALAGAGLAGVGLVGLAHGAVPAAVGLFELKDEVARITQAVMATLQKRLTGLNRFKRSELLEAAHAVLVVSAFFDALDRRFGTAGKVLYLLLGHWVISIRDGRAIFEQFLILFHWKLHRIVVVHQYNHDHENHRLRCRNADRA